MCPALRTTLGAESKNAVSLREPIFIAQICHKIGEQSAEQSTLLFVLCIEKIIYYHKINEIITSSTLNSLSETTL